MYLHIVHDSIFTQYAVDNFDSSEHEFVLLMTANSPKRSLSSQVRRISWLNIFNPFFLKSLQKYKLVFLHYLGPLKQRLVLNSSNSVNFSWIGWGGDIYPYLKGCPLYLPKTLQYLKDSDVKRASLKAYFKSKIMDLVFPSNSKYKEVIGRIKYCAPVIQNEYKLLCHHFSCFSAKYVDWNYCSITDLTLGARETECLKIPGTILIGNSGSFTNNHLDMIYKLSKFDLPSDNKIIIPLSYGASEEYKVKIDDVCSKQLSNEVTLLDKFMPLDEYNGLISKCEYAVFGHLRQEALGTIILLLYSGTKVFMESKSPLYEFLKNSGVCVYAIDLVDSLGDKLPIEVVNNNRSCLELVWSQNVMREKTRAICQL